MQSVKQVEFWIYLSFYTAYPKNICAPVHFRRGFYFVVLKLFKIDWRLS